MSLSHERVRQALRVALAGKGKLYMPEVTTYQRRHNEGLLRQVEEQGIDGATVFFWDMWFVWYIADVHPDAVPAPYTWTQTEVGVVGHAVADGIFTIVDNVDADYLFYAFAEATMDSAHGTIFEARIRVNAASAGANTGAGLSIYDGTRQFTLWLRDDGINIDKQPDAPVDMTVFRRIKFVCQGEGSQVYVDGELRQSGDFTNWTNKRMVLFGSYVEEP